jgi:beta-galactosidase
MIVRPDSMAVVPDIDLVMNYQFVLKKDCDWAKADYVVASEQFPFNDIKLPSKEIQNKGRLTVSEANENLTVKGKGFSASWNTKNGNLTSLIYSGKEMLASQAKDFELQPVVQAFRAPTDNDKGFGNWLAKEWKQQKLDSSVVIVDSVHHSIRKDGALEFTVYKTNQYKNGFINTIFTYITTADGTIDLQVNFKPEGTLPDLPRLGIAVALNPELEQYSWYGEGPWENYPDRKSASTVGLWISTVTEQYFAYPRPQETGNHENIRFLTLTNTKKQGIKVHAIDKTFSASAIHYSVSDLTNETHACNLIPRKEVILSLDCAVLGLGNSSCGPGVLKKYAIEKKEHVLLIRITPNP